MSFIPNKISVCVEGKRYNSLSIPLINGTYWFISNYVSPLLIINYLCNGVYFDKFIDKHDVDIKRYHQYDGQNNKYVYLSLFIIIIQKDVNKIL